MERETQEEKWGSKSIRQTFVYYDVSTDSVSYAIQ